jgi:hypothetical protein
MLGTFVLAYGQSPAARTDCVHGCLYSGLPGTRGTRPPEADGLADSWRVKRAPPRSGSVRGPDSSCIQLPSAAHLSGHTNPLGDRRRQRVGTLGWKGHVTGALTGESGGDVFDGADPVVNEGGHYVWAEADLTRFRRVENQAIEARRP